jgi:transcriptional regulator with XRE-family HTH domain
MDTLVALRSKAIHGTFCPSRILASLPRSYGSASLRQRDTARSFHTLSLEAPASPADERAVVPPAGEAKASHFRLLMILARVRAVTPLARTSSGAEDERMLRSSTRVARKRSTARERTQLWARVGAFVRARREELGLSQGDIIRVLAYKSRNAVSNIELGIEGLPAKRAYAWADLLEVPRDAFFRFITGEADELPLPPQAAQREASERLSAAEAELLSAYRRLPPKYQRRLREHAQEYETLASASQSGKRS